MTRATNLYRHEAYKTWADRKAAADDVIVDTPDPVTSFVAAQSGATTMDLTWVNPVANAGLLAQVERAAAAGAGGAVACTFQDTGDTVTVTAHGWQNGQRVMFATVVTTTGIVTNQSYYVINRTDNTFQVADTVGGAAKVLTTDGTGTVFVPTFTYSVIDIVNADDEAYADTGLTTATEYQYRIAVLAQTPQPAATRAVAYDKTA